MNPRWIPVLAALAVVANAAAGAPQVEAAREAHQRAQAHLVELEARQRTLQAELDSLGNRIESLKAQRRNKVMVSSDLKKALERSQELSSSLTSVATELKTARSQNAAADQGLETAFDNELATLRERWERAATSDEKSKLIVQMRQLRAERERARRPVDPTSIPSVGPARSEDPEELLEQSDALKDAEDKARKQLAQVEHRIAELEDERELDRRMGQFNRDQALFDEQERTLRASREQPTFGTAARPAIGPAPADSASSPGTPPLPPALTPSAVAPEVLSGSSLKALEAQRDRLHVLADELKRRSAEAAAKARDSR